MKYQSIDDLCMTDPPRFVHNTHHILEVNDSACELFRCYRQDLLYLPMMRLIVNPDFRGLAKLRMVVMREHKRAAGPMRYKYRRFDGSRFWASVESKHLGDDNLFETVLVYEGEA